MKRNDILWKGVLEDLFDDFLRFFYPNADELFAFDKGFEYLDKELDQLFPPDDNIFAPRYVDKLVKVFTKDGDEKWILIHVEVQGYTDKNFAKRMFQYYLRIFDKYDKPITAFAIFTDANKGYHPNQYKNSFLGTKVSYTFNTFKIIAQDDAALEASNNPFAMVVLSAKLALSGRRVKDHQLFDMARDLAKLLLTKQMPKDKIRKVMSFLHYYLRFEKQEMLAKFEKEIAILTERNITMGIEELLLDLAEKKGIEKGIKEGIEQGVEKGAEKNTREIAQKMIENGIDINLISNITGLSIGELEKLAEKN